MERALDRRLLSTRPRQPGQEALLGLLVAAAHLRDRLDHVCAGFGLSHGQYNVLRILEGGPADGYPRCDIAKRLIDRAPDVTRLVDRLERRGLVVRCRSTADRRLSLARLSPEASALLAEMRPAIDAVHHQLGELLGLADCRELTRICERIYGEELP